MCRNKGLKLFVTGLAASALVLNGSGSLIPQDEISEETANYRTDTVKLSEVYGDITCSASVYCPAEENIYFKGEEAVYNEPVVIAQNLVKKDDPVYSITPVIDEIHLEELHLKRQEADKVYADQTEDRAMQVKDLQDQLAIAVQNGDVYMQDILSIRLKQKEVESAKAEYEYTRDAGKIDEEIAEIEEARDTLTIDAPADGKLTWMEYLTEGDRIFKGKFLGVLTDMDHACLKANNSIPAGQEVKITVSFRGTDYDFDGKCVLNCAELSGGVKEGSIISYDPALLDMLPTGTDIAVLDQRGVSIKVNYRTYSLKNVLTVSVDALIQDGSRTYVDLLDENNTLHRRPVKVLLYRNSRDAIILSGLSEGDAVVLQ